MRKKEDQEKKEKNVFAKGERDQPSGMLRARIMRADYEIWQYGDHQASVIFTEWWPGSPKRWVEERMEEQDMEKGKQCARESS